MIKRAIYRLLFGRPVEAIYLSAREHWQKGGVHKFYAHYLTKKIQKKFGCYLSPRAKVGSCFTLKHPVGVVIGDGVIIGNNVTIYQNVTLGAARIGEGLEGLYPTLANNAVVYAGAVIIGNITVGAYSIVAANAVVTKSCEPKTILLGIPARSMKSNMSNKINE